MGTKRGSSSSTKEGAADVETAKKAIAADARERVVKCRSEVDSVLKKYHCALQSEVVITGSDIRSFVKIAPLFDKGG